MKSEELDWAKLPPELNYLSTLAVKYGHYQFDDAIDDYLFNQVTKSDLLELRDLRDQMWRDFDAIETWLDEYNMTKHPEARLVYFTRCLIGTADDSHMFDDIQD